jgi:aminoglycoside phosphotransferase family enzyme/predicted kinase
MTPLADDDQREVIAFLSTPDAYGPDIGPVDRIDTHISIVWLAGRRAYKLKRAVRFDYVDFSTLERRRLACGEEVRLNRRTAPELYLGVRPVTRERDGTLALGGGGEAVDWLVEMVRFEQHALFDALAERRGLDPALMPPLAAAIARLHAGAEHRRDRGGAAGMAWVIDGNARGFDVQGAGILDVRVCERLAAASRAELDREAKHLDLRRDQGFVRACHGDLHLRNICLVDGVPTLFDAVEFNENISCIDVLYDLSFLLMDLWRRDLRAHANLVFNEYLAGTGDLTGVALLPLFLSCRAAVRAKTSATAAMLQGSDRQKARSQTAASEYLALAEELLRPERPCLVAVGGLSGSGKSTLARGVAPLVGRPPGALVLRSDVIRKASLGFPATVHLPAEAYAADVSRRVYDTIADGARAALLAGHAVIADAVYSAPAARERIAATAREVGVPFIGLWIDGPIELLKTRVRERVNDASDATAAVVDSQAGNDIGVLDWHRLDGAGDIETVRRSAERILAASLHA